MTRRRRILLVTPFAPAADGRHGGARAVHGLACELVERHDVVLLHLDRDELDPAIAARCRAVHAIPIADAGPWAVRARGAAGVVRGRSLKAAASAVPALRRRARDLAELTSPDVVQVEFGILGDVLAAVSGALRVVTIHDPAASLGEGQALRRDGLPFAHRLDARAALREERRVLRAADGAVVFTERDRGLVARSAPAGMALATIGLGWDVPAVALDPVGTSPPTLLFVGGYRHPPNVAAALALAQRILPTVRARHPDVRLELVGGSPPRELLALAGEAIFVPGEVASVTPYLDRAAVVVAPITLGGGMRVKVLEALAAGKAVVASTRAAEGIGARAGEEIAIADGDAATAQAISRLLADPGARRRMAGRAREWALRELSWSAMADSYDELYARLDHQRAERPAVAR
ncbi:MAG: polysaccharide biosynthesis protein PslH [Solirubrobacteraceae bacterium]|nr:polysaccharide biosynthesis protein PslH [Solirubrobacteraceae bacterium]